MTSVSLALDCKAVLGESPVCHPNGGVSFVDIYGKCVNHYDSVGGGHEVLNVPSVVCCIVPRAKGGLLAALDVRSYYPALYETVAFFYYWPFSIANDEFPEYKLAGMSYDE